MAENTTQWVDLSAHGLTLAVCEVGGMRLLGVSGQPDEASRSALESLDFVQATDDLWVREGDQVDMTPLLEAFTGARLISVPMEEFSQRFLIRGTAPRRTTEESKREREAAAATRRSLLSELLSGSRKLGFNHLGQEVWAHGDDVRFLLQSESKNEFSVLAEGTREFMNDGLFLRATNPQAALAAADGYVESLASGEVSRWDDLRRLAGVLWGDGTPVEENHPRIIEADAMIEAASARWLARRNSRSATEAFHGAQRIQEARAWRADLARRTDAAPRLSLPLSVAMQRIIGTESELRGKSVLALGAPSLGAFVASSAVVSAISPDRDVQAGILSAGRRMSSVLGEGENPPETPYGLLYAVSRAVMGGEAPVIIDGLELFARDDFADAADALLKRDPAGRAVFAFEAPANDVERADLAAFHLWVAQRWAIEGAIEIAPSLGMGGPGDLPDRFVLAVGQRRPDLENTPPPVAMQVETAGSYADIWKWTSSVTVNRAEIGNHYGTTAEDTSEDEAKVSELQVNRFQSPYVSLSRIGTASTMVPRNLEAATREAQEKLQAAHPDFDNWVCGQIGVTTEQAELAFSPEQIDAVGMILYAWERKRAALLGDMTGLGKGRSMAAVMRAAILAGKKVLFITERPLGFGEIARDFQDIGAWDDLAPFVMNANVDIKDEVTPRMPGEEAPSILQSADRELVRSVTGSGKWPEGCNIMFSTFSQFNRAGEVKLEKADKLALKKLQEAKKAKDAEDSEKIYDAPEAIEVAVHATSPAEKLGISGDMDVIAALDAALGLEDDDTQPVQALSSLIIPEMTVEQVETDAEQAEVAPAPEEDDEDLGVVEGVPEGVSPKSWWLRHAIDKDTVVILDESHNAAVKKSNSGSNVAEAVEKAGQVLFSSATYAKNARTMEVYAPLFPVDFDSSNISEIINRGGDDMHAILTNMLVKDCVMVSRQHDLSKCQFLAQFDDNYSDRNRDYLARLAPILSEMSYMSGDIGRRLNDLNSRKAQELKSKYKDNEDVVRGKMKTMGMRTVAFGSPLYQITKLAVASLLVDSTVDGWVKALEEGRKPMVFTENTIQGLMSDLQDEGTGRLPDFRDLMLRVLNQLCRVTRSGKKKGEVVEVNNPFLPSEQESMADRLAIIMRGTMSAVLLADMDPDELTMPELDEKGESIPDVIRSPWKVELYAGLAAAADLIAEQDGLDLTDDGPRAALVLSAMDEVHQLIEDLHPARSDNVDVLRAFPDYLPPTPARSKRKIADMILKLPDLPASAIDEIRERVETEGLARFERGEIDRPWVVGEITGRSLEVRNGEIVNRSKGNKFDLRNGFNNGSIDALILNAAGATSVSLHAGARCKDQRQREMWMLQQHGDIMKFIQAIGRIYRFDQVIGPIIVTPLLRMPAHERLLAMQNVKLSRLSANMQASREHPASMNDIADLMNRIGDDVVKAWSEDHPDVLRRMGLEIDEMDADEDENEKKGKDNESRDNDYLAHKFMSRLVLLPPELQESVLEEIKVLYKSTLQELNDKGENPLETRVIQGTVHVRSSDIYLGHDADGVDSVFHDPVLVQKVVIEHTEDPLRFHDVGERIDSGMASYVMQGIHELPAYLKERRDAQVRKHLMPGQTEQQAVISGGAVAGIVRRLDQLLNTLPRCIPGMVVNMSMEGVPVKGVITAVHAPQGEEAANSFDGYVDKALRQSRSEFIASNYELSIAIPGTFMTQKRRLSSLLSEAGFDFIGHISEEIDGLAPVDADEIVDAFDKALEGTRQSARLMLRGNDWAAMQAMLEHKLGYPVVYKDENGNLSRAVMVTKTKESLNFLPIRMRGANHGTDMASSLIGEGNIKLYGVRRVGGSKDIVKGDKSDGLTVTYLKKKKKVKFSLPRDYDIKHGWLMRHEAVKELVSSLGQNDPLDHFSAENNKKQCILVDPKDAATVMRVFVDVGLAFYAPASMNTVVDEWKARQIAAEIEEIIEEVPVEEQEPEADPMAVLAAA